MLRIVPPEAENDGSNRAFAWCCRGVGQDYNDSDIELAFRKAEKPTRSPAGGRIPKSSDAFAKRKTKLLAVSNES